MPVKKIDETCSDFECLSKEVFFGLDMVFKCKTIGSQFNLSEKTKLSENTFFFEGSKQAILLIILIGSQN